MTSIHPYNIAGFILCVFLLLSQRFNSTACRLLMKQLFHISWRHHLSTKFKKSELRCTKTVSAAAKLGGLERYFLALFYRLSPGIILYSRIFWQHLTKARRHKLLKDIESEQPAAADFISSRIFTDLLLCSIGHVIFEMCSYERYCDTVTSFSEHFRQLAPLQIDFSSKHLPSLTFASKYRYT